MCLQKTKWVEAKVKELDTSRFRLWYIRKVRAKNGVSIIVDKKWKNNVVKVKRIEDRILSFKMKFWKDLEGLVQGIPLQEKIIVGGDLYCHVGKDKG